MKQVSNATESLIPVSFRNNLMPQPRTHSKYLFVLLLAGIGIFSSSFQNIQKKSVPFRGKYEFSFGADGVSGTGNGSLVGRFTLVEQNNNEGFPVITGTATITAANGDQIFATHTGYVNIIGNGIAQVDAVFNVTGGTGNFTGATGSFESHGPANLALGTGSAAFEGTLSTIR